MGLWTVFTSEIYATGGRRDKRPVTGYFISLAGFRETAIEQEKQGRRTKIITLTGPQVVGELVRGRILIAKDRATEMAGRCCSALGHLILDPEAELLAHERGWIWAVYYTQGKARTHFVLIHSDGTPLARALAEEIIASDRACKGKLHKLSCLNPAPPPEEDSSLQVESALASYGQYLANECGYIQLDGLPADSEVGSRRLRLENLFVPLHLDVTVQREGESRKMERQAVGTALAAYPRLALLAAPGGGKSTLIKRLAVAYADPARRRQIADDIPERDWLPLFFRCRELRGLARGSFADLLDALTQQEPVRQHASVFRAHVDRALLASRVLLLVDGLDEISDPGDRAAFVCTLRAALQAYPNTAIVVTSREAGFRHVAAHFASVCTRATLSPFDPEDIRRLSVAWHREVVGEAEKVRTDAEQLADTIVRNDRIRRLAVNPLLLTTLLLVKRWVGSLPTRRAVLYGKAVEVLLMTWNTEGHDPIPEEEALPQLCYVASAMMFEGVQKISRPRLASLLQEARDALPTELGYVKGTVDQFIHRVEDRSSLLMMTGHDVEDGRLAEFFEFRHLTFQEFLTARAMVEGWHPAREEGDTLASVLEPHLEKEEWREVIPLAAVLGGKATEALIQRLTEKAGKLEGIVPGDKDPVLLALGNCLADEAAARPETIRSAIRQLVHFGTSIVDAPFIQVLCRGKYGPELRDEARRAFLSGVPDFESADALLSAVWWQTLETNDIIGLEHAAKQFFQMLYAPETLTRCEGALGLGRLFNDIWRDVHLFTECVELSRRSGPILVNMLAVDTPEEEHIPALYALRGLGACRFWTPPADLDIIGLLYRLWRSQRDPNMAPFVASALSAQPLVPREDGRQWISISRVEIKRVIEVYDGLNDMNEKPAALIVAWYVHALDDAEIARRAHALVKLAASTTSGQTLRELLEHLGLEEDLLLELDVEGTRT
jgi:hypothetical protein